MARKVISVCTPCFNEEENIRRCYETVKDIFERELPDYDREHLFSDNCSTDRTVAILREIAVQDPRVKVIVNRRNFGVIRSGYNNMLNATGDAVVMALPADIQDPPDLIPQFVREWEKGYDIVYGMRAEREEALVMRSLRKAYYRLISKLSHLDIPPDVGDFTLVDKVIIEAMRRCHDLYPFTRTMPFEFTSHAKGIPYRWRKREGGVSKNRLINLIDQGMNGIIAVSYVPTRLALFGGSLLALGAFAHALWTLFGTVIFGSPAQPGIPTLMVGLMMLNGVLLFFVGLLGEYLIALHSHVRTRPLVVERERINFTEPPPVSISIAAPSQAAAAARKTVEPVDG